MFIFSQRLVRVPFQRKQVPLTLHTRTPPVRFRKVIANPNCTTAIGLMALYPLHKKYGIKKVIMSTYQASPPLPSATRPHSLRIREATHLLLLSYEIDSGVED